MQLVFDEDPDSDDNENPVLSGGDPPANADNNDPDLTLTTNVNVNILRIAEDDDRPLTSSGVRQ